MCKRNSVSVSRATLGVICCIAYHAHIFQLMGLNELKQILFFTEVKWTHCDKVFCDSIINVFACEISAKCITAVGSRHHRHHRSYLSPETGQHWPQSIPSRTCLPDHTFQTRLSGRQWLKELKPVKKTDPDNGGFQHSQVSNRSKWWLGHRSQRKRKEDFAIQRSLYLFCAGRSGVQ